MFKLSHLVLAVEWEEWLPWSECDVYTCQRSRRRKCTCTDDISSHLNMTMCGPRENSYQEEVCQTSKSELKKCFITYFIHFQSSSIWIVSGVVR